MSAGESNVSKAGREAGYAHAQAAHRAFDGLKTRFGPALLRAGLDEDYVVEHCIKPATNAEKIVHHHQIVLQTTRDVDHATRLNAGDMAVKLHGGYVLTLVYRRLKFP